MPRIFVTGATGFIGQAMLPWLLAHGYTVRAAIRRAETVLPTGVEGVVVGDLGPHTDWQTALDGVDGVIHLAARVHQMVETDPDPKAAFFRVNTAGTLALAEQAQAAGVKRFIFVSTVKAALDGTGADDHDFYGQSKKEAENQLLAMKGSMGVTVIQPHLVYGPHAKGNFASLLRLCAAGIPLPLGAVRNQRGVVYVENLVDAIGFCLSQPQACGKALAVHDDNPLSTPALIRAIWTAMGKKGYLIPVPVALLSLLGRITGQRAKVSRLTQSLVIDDTPLRVGLGWTPPYSTSEGLRRTVAALETGKKP